MSLSSGVLIKDVVLTVSKNRQWIYCPTFGIVRECSRVIYHISVKWSRTSLLIFMFVSTLVVINFHTWSVHLAESPGCGLCRTQDQFYCCNKNYYCNFTVSENYEDSTIKNWTTFFEIFMVHHKQVRHYMQYKNSLLSCSSDWGKFGQSVERWLCHQEARRDFQCCLSSGSKETLHLSSQLALLTSHTHYNIDT